MDTVKASVRFAVMAQIRRAEAQGTEISETRERFLAFWFRVYRLHVSF
jgi:hypothetical protein